jgi:RNA polymerase sigma factor (sigma-70 family)
LKTWVFTSAEKFLSTCHAGLSGCAIIDICMPGMNGLELQQTLNARRIDLPVILLTGQGDIPMAVLGMKQGAVEFLEKPYRSHELIDAIQRGIRASQIEREQEQCSRELAERYGQLTARERQVLEMVLEGMPNKRIATQLGISQRTVEVHRARVMKKLQASSFAELVRMALDLQEVRENRNNST